MKYSPYIIINNPKIKSIQNQVFFEQIYSDKNVDKYPKQKKKKKLANIAPKPNKNLSSKLEDIDPIKITVSK